MEPKTQQQVPWLNEVTPDELRRIVDVLYRVHRFNAVITELDTLLERIMEEGRQVANAEACSLMLYDPETDELYFEVALGNAGDQQALKKEIRLKPSQGIAGVAAASRESINVEDAQTDPRFYDGADIKSQFKTRSILAVPMIEHDRLVGVIELVNKVGSEPFTDTDLHVMEIFAGLVATVIANARLIEENVRAERLAAIGQAVAGLSHYAKNIIASLNGSVDLIDQGFDSGDIEFYKRTWPILKRSVHRIGNLVENMLAYSKSRQPLRERCRLQDIADDVSGTFWTLLARKNVHFDIDVDGIQEKVMLDTNGVFRCLLNLVLNAADAVQNDTGCIRLHAKPIDETNLLIEVGDNGPGVPEEAKEQVFDLFFSTKGSRGTGLGLAVSRKIVQEHGGSITIHTDPVLGGALFQIVLPCRTIEEIQ